MGSEIVIKGNSSYEMLSKMADEVFEPNYLAHKIIECYGQQKANSQAVAWGNVFSNISVQVINKDTKEKLGDRINKSDRLKRQFIEEISKLMDKGVEMDSRNFYCAPHNLGKPDEKLEINFMVGYKKDILHKMGVFIVKMGVVYQGDEYEECQNDKGQPYPLHKCHYIMAVMQAKRDAAQSIINKIQFGYVCYKYKEEQRILMIPKEQISCSLKKTTEGTSYSIKLNALGIYGAIEVILWKKLFNEIIYNDIAYNYEFEKSEQIEQQPKPKESIAEITKRKALEDFKKEKEQKEQKIKEAEQVEVEQTPIESTWLKKHKNFVDSAHGDLDRLRSGALTYENMHVGPDVPTEQDKQAIIAYVNSKIAEAEKGTETNEKEGMF